MKTKYEGWMEITEFMETNENASSLLLNAFVAVLMSPCISQIGRLPSIGPKVTCLLIQVHTTIHITFRSLENQRNANKYV